MKSDGREQEFESLYSRYQKQVWALIFARILDSELALDITQEAFTRLWQEWESGKTIQHPRAWLMRVSRNLAEDYAKSAFRKKGTTDPLMMKGIASKDTGPMEFLEKNERFAVVRQVLDELPTTDREILTLRYCLDYEPTTIAELLELQPSAVYVRLSRARQRLSERFKLAGLGSNT